MWFFFSWWTIFLSLAHFHYIYSMYSCYSIYSRWVCSVDRGFLYVPVRGWVLHLARSICMLAWTSWLCYVCIDPVFWLLSLLLHTVSWRCWRAIMQLWWCNRYLCLHEWHNASGQEGRNKRPSMVCVKAQLPLFSLLSSNFLLSIDLTLFRVVTISDPWKGLLWNTFSRLLHMSTSFIPWQHKSSSHGSSRLPSSTTANV